MSKILVANLVALTMAISSAVLAFQNSDKWGWFLVGAILTFHTVNTEDKD